MAEVPVHPRVGGERLRRSHREIVSIGSSPRGRGTPYTEICDQTHERFIPAWAGNANSKFRSSRPTPVHPRVGGERGFRLSSRPSANGSSPRGRGTRPTMVRDSDDTRFIPAWAGNAYLPNSTVRSCTVHPRVGGERPSRRSDTSLHRGSSPRGRGTLLPSLIFLHFKRFIPAWAGNASQQSHRRSSASVHPRVGGERG